VSGFRCTWTGGWPVTRLLKRHLLFHSLNPESLILNPALPHLPSITYRLIITCIFNNIPALTG
jgi:hypothetical protein